MRLSLIAAVSLVALLGANPASAGLFGGKKADAPATAVAAAPGQTNMPSQGDLGQAPETFHKASAAEVQKVLRSDPLSQAGFFANQFEHDPTDAASGLHMSDALRALGRYAEAADAAHRVLLFAPNNTDGLLAAARAHIADNNGFYAIDPLKHLLELKPNSWEAYSLLGVAYDQVKRPDDAQTAWAQALKLSPNNPAVLTNQAMSKVQKGDLAGAEPLLRTAAAQKDATIQTRQNLALVLGLQGKMDEAERLLRQDLPPEQADADLAWLQANRLQPGGAPAKATTPPAGTARSWDSVKNAGG
ncbi:MAG TPA: tetratricopeptide repeat protein [Asticcacaulis sp.]|nr:tetratricopeptide repeat protein [Asticcacaulis sp.]